jgi:transglutaminase-like putative cysteine protease
LLLLPILKNKKRPERTFDFTYTFQVKDIPADAKNVSIWFPIPRSNSVQRLMNFELLDSVPYSILIDEEYGNKFIYISLNRKGVAGNEFGLDVKFQVWRRQYNKREPLDDMQQDLDTSLQRYLAPDSMVPVDGRIAEEARNVISNLNEKFFQAKKLFYHIVDTVKYDKSGTGWGRGDALYACDVRKGNCTDFHSLYIGELRSLGIPARFIIGFPLPEEEKEGEINGYHCWSEFYIEGLGWIPVDASEAQKDYSNRKNYFANLDPNRVSFTIGRDINMPRANSEPLNYVIYPYVEIDGGRHENVVSEFHFKDIE